MHVFAHVKKSVFAKKNKNNAILGAQKRGPIFEPITSFFLLQVLFDLIVQSPLNKKKTHHHFRQITTIKAGADDRIPPSQECSPHPALIGDFAFNGEGSCFCSTVTGLLGRTALGAKKMSVRHRCAKFDSRSHS